MTVDIDGYLTYLCGYDTAKKCIQDQSRERILNKKMIVKTFHKEIGDFKLAGNPIKMSTNKDEKTRGDIPDLDEHREKILKEFT